MKKKEMLERLANIRNRSAWNKGVTKYAIEILEDIEADEITIATLAKWNWNGAGDALSYSENGRPLISGDDICERLCPPSIVRKHPSRPNGKESWIDVQGRALDKAMYMIKKMIFASVTFGVYIRKKNGAEQAKHFIENSDARWYARKLAYQIMTQSTDNDYKNMVNDETCICVVAYDDSLKEHELAKLFHYRLALKGDTRISEEVI